MNINLILAIRAAIEAGKAILDIYQTDFSIEYKDDTSPLTLADKKANDIILRHLKETNIPVLSEEGRSIPYQERKLWNQLWIVDPLDGTKEFIKKNGEFTVNIALIKNQEPVLGVVYAPVLDELYFSDEELGAYKLENTIKKTDNLDNLIALSSKLPLNISKSYFGIVASRSHLTPETTSYIDKIKKGHNAIKIISKGSSLKLVMVAEGIADVYPRFAPTSEWDTAAGHAIVLASGGRVVQANNQIKDLIYNKEDILNPWFIVKK